MSTTQDLTETEMETLDGPMPVKDYRAVSVLGVASLVLGLISGVAVFSPILVVIPLVAAAVGGYSLWHIKANSDRLSGRWMAAVPLVLAPLFAGWGFSREYARREIFLAHAKEFTDDYLEILNRNEPYVAHQLRVQRKHRLDPKTNLQVAYQADETATSQMKMFLESSPSKEIMAAAPNVKFQFEEFVTHRHAGLTDVATLQYTYESPNSEKTRFWINLRRDFNNYTGRADWQIMDVTLNRIRSR